MSRKNWIRNSFRLNRQKPVRKQFWGKSICLNFGYNGKIAICPVCPWDGWGFVLGTIVQQGPLEKCLCVFLVAPYCAIPRDYLSDTPLLRAMGFLVSQHGKLGAIPPPPFLSVSPLESMRSGGAIPPLKRGISAILARYPMKTRQMGAISPSAILSRKGIARYGGVNRLPGEFINWGLFIKLKGLLCGNPTERGESLILNFWPPGNL